MQTSICVIYPYSGKDFKLAFLLSKSYITEAERIIEGGRERGSLLNLQRFRTLFTNTGGLHTYSEFRFTRMSWWKLVLVGNGGGILSVSLSFLCLLFLPLWSCLSPLWDAPTERERTPCKCNCTMSVQVVFDL